MDILRGKNVTLSIKKKQLAITNVTRHSLYPYICQHEIKIWISRTYPLFAMCGTHSRMIRNVDFTFTSKSCRRMIILTVHRHWVEITFLLSNDKNPCMNTQFLCPCVKVTCYLLNIMQCRCP